MQLLLRTTLIFAALTAWTWLDFPRRFDLSFPREPGPRFDPQVRQVYIEVLEQQRPEIVLLGDSGLAAAVDEESLTRLTGRRTLSISINGSASALWYLVIKNNLVEAPHPPRYLLLLFRDTMLTAPGFRVQGNYFAGVDEFAHRKERVVVERAFVNLMNPLDYAAERYVPAYGARTWVRTEIDAAISYSLPALAGCDRACTDEHLFFDVGRDFEPGQLRAAIAAAEGYLYTPPQLDFNAQVDESFLPEIIRLTRERGVQLVAVRLRARVGQADEAESRALRAYVVELKEYLDANDVPFLDFGTDPRLESRYFSDPTHLNEPGRILFTELLAQALEPLLR